MHLFTLSDTAITNSHPNNSSPVQGTLGADFMVCWTEEIVCLCDPLGLRATSPCAKTQPTKGQCQRIICIVLILENQLYMILPNHISAGVVEACTVRLLKADVLEIFTLSNMQLNRTLKKYLNQMSFISYSKLRDIKNSILSFSGFKFSVSCSSFITRCLYLHRIW